MLTGGHTWKDPVNTAVPRLFMMLMGSLEKIELPTMGTEQHLSNKSIVFSFYFFGWFFFSRH